MNLVDAGRSVSASTAGRDGVVGRRALDEDESRVRRKAMLAGVIGQRDARVLVNAIELAPESKRGGEADPAGLPLAQSDRRDRSDHSAAGGRHISQRRREVATNDLVTKVRPHPTTRPLRITTEFIDPAARANRPSGELGGCEHIYACTPRRHPTPGQASLACSGSER